MEDINNNEPLKKANEVLNEISDDEYEQELAFKRKLYLMDKKAIRESGYDKGLADGIEQGTIQEKIKVAEKMLEEKVSIETIIKCTGLTEEEIEKLK